MMNWGLCVALKYPLKGSTFQKWHVDRVGMHELIELYIQITHTHTHTPHKIAIQILMPYWNKRKLPNLDSHTFLQINFFF